MTDVQGIHHPNVAEWLSERVSFVAPLTFELITGGHSNLTYRVTDGAGTRWVLRRPPLGKVLSTAHDMSREVRIVSALQGSGVPVPTIVGLCEDPAVNEAPFYVMNFVDGTVARNVAAAQKLPADIRRESCRSLISTLATLHALDPDSVGLGELGKKADYIARQLRRWKRQVESQSQREIPLFDAVHAELVRRIPVQKSAGIVHGDYRLDNCIVREDGSIAAVLDWELCTLGDVRADVGMLLTYWAEPDDELKPLPQPPTIAPGFATRAELVEWYREATDTSFAEVDYFVAFSHWRLASILEGVFSRYTSAAMGDHVPQNVQYFLRVVDQLVARSSRILDGTITYS